MCTTASPPVDSARRFTRRPVRAVFTRYAVGSVLAGVVSEAVLLAAYGPGLLGPQAASVAGWAAGAVLNYGLNRWWAWGRRGRASLWRELVPYWTITLTSLAISAWLTGLADRMGPRLFEGEGMRVAFVGGVFLVVYGLMFLVKFALYHYLVFPGRSRARSAVDAGPDQDAGVRLADRRSRDQVPTTTRK